MSEREPHELVHAFADGELEPAEAEPFRAHLAGCADCQRELHDIMMLAAVAQTHHEALRAPPPSPTVVPLRTVTVVPLRTAAPRRSRRRVWAAATAGLAAAAGLAVAWQLTRPAPIVLAQAETRSLEARLAYPGADRYRPYEVMRSQGASREEVPLATLARLERDHDLHGLGVGYLLSGDGARAAEALAVAGDSAAVLSDRAAEALRRHDAAAALAAADAALRAGPGQPQATWNRALALRNLQLPLTAALSFDAVAAHGEPGWADEARQRAAALRAAEAERERAYRSAAQAGKSLIAGGPLPSPEVVRAFAGLVRRDLYDAARAAPTRARRLALLPLAEALDGSHALAARLQAEPPPKPALAASYATLATNPAALPPAAADRYLATLERVHADDLRLGALVLLGRVAAARAEVRRLAAAERDPWWLSLADQADGEAALADGNAAAAEQLLGDGDRRCLAAGIDFRCAALELALADAQLRQRRLDQAQATAQAGLARARTAGVDPRDLERRFLLLLAQVARERGQAALAAAYVAEARLRMP